MPGRTTMGDGGPSPLPRVPLRVMVRRALRRLKRWTGLGRLPELPAWPVTDDSPADHDLSVAREPDRIVVTVRSLRVLRGRLGDLDSAASYQRFGLRVEQWTAPWPGWAGRLGPLPGLLHHEVTLPPGGSGPVSLAVTVSEPVPVLAMVIAVLPVLDPWRPLPATGRVVAVAPDRVPRWLRPELVTPVPAKEPTATTRWPVRPHDSGLADDSALPAGSALADDLPPTGIARADATSANPIGRQRYGSDLCSGNLVLSGDATGYRWEITREPGREPGGEPVVVVAGRIGDPLDERQTAVLNQVRALTLDPPSAEIPASVVAATLAQLAMTGVVGYAPALPEEARDRLAGDLVELLQAPLPDPAADPLEWELRSVAQRRAALREHGLTAVSAGLTAGYRSLARPPTVSALLVTRRPQLVLEAVRSMAVQTYPELEIVVGLHGVDLPAAGPDLDQLTAFGRPVRVVPIPGDLSFGEALAEATRAASGTLVTKVDDDDRYGPEHIWDLVLARYYSGATVVGKGAEFVYLAQHDATVRRWMGSELYTDVVAGGTMLISIGDLAELGGWRPLPRGVDRGLLDRVLGGGGLVYRTHGFGFTYVRSGEAHTWVVDPGYFARDPRNQWPGLPPYPEFGPR